MSLKQVAGGPSPAAIAETRKNAKAASGVSGKYAVVDGSDQATNEYPYVPFAPDDYDDIATIKKTAGGGALGANWVVPFTDSDAAYMRRQRDQVENADFDRWVMQKYDLTNPAELFLFQSIAPEQFQRRLDLIDYEQNIVSKFAKLRCMGARSLEDLKFEWLIETGRIELPQGPIWDPVAWMTKQAGMKDPSTEEQWAERGIVNRERFMAGLFSPLKYLNDNETGWNRNAANPADIRGNPFSPTMGQLFTGANRPNAPYARYGYNPIREADTVPYGPGVNGGRFGRGLVGHAREIVAPARSGYGGQPYYMTKDEALLASRRRADEKAERDARALNYGRVEGQRNRAREERAAALEQARVMGEANNMLQAANAGNVQAMARARARMANDGQFDALFAPDV